MGVWLFYCGMPHYIVNEATAQRLLNDGAQPMSDPTLATEAVKPEEQQIVAQIEQDLAKAPIEETKIEEDTHGS